MVVARSPRQLAGFNYEKIIESIDWNRVLIQAEGLHMQAHGGTGDNTCGFCLQLILLRREDW